jgi:hypothetical protein
MTADLVKAGTRYRGRGQLRQQRGVHLRKGVLAVESIADRLKEEMRANGAFELTGSRSKR